MNCIDKTWIQISFQIPSSFIIHTKNLYEILLHIWIHLIEKSEISLKKSYFLQLELISQLVNENLYFAFQTINIPRVDPPNMSW